MTITNTTLSSICSFNVTNASIDTGNDYLKGYFSDKPYQNITHKFLDLIVKCNVNYNTGMLGEDYNIYYMPSAITSARPADGKILKINTENDTAELTNQISILESDTSMYYLGGIRLNNNKVFVPYSGRYRYSYLFDFNTNTASNFNQRIGTVKSNNTWVSFVKNNNKIYGIPRNDVGCAVFNLDDNTAIEINSVFEGNQNTLDSILHFNGLIYMISKNGVYAFNPETNIIVDHFGDDNIFTVNNNGEAYINPHASIILHPNGNIYTIAYLWDGNPPDLFEINVVDRTVTKNKLQTNNFISRAHTHLTLAPNGKLYSRDNRILKSTEITYLFEIDIVNNKYEVVHEFNSSLYSYSDSSIPFMHPNGKIYIIPKTYSYDEKTILVYDTGCPAKDPSVFLSDHLNRTQKSV